MSFIPFHVEHVIATQHGGADDVDNYAWACHRCNAYKGTNLSSVDAESGSIVPLFNPRGDSWEETFRFNGAEIVGLTPSGRATVKLLAFNDSYRVELREEWLRDHHFD